MGRHASRAVFALVPAALIGGILPSACSTFGSDDPAPETESGADAAQASLDASADPNPDPDPGTCPPNAFCDEFDDGYKLPRMWTTVSGNPPERIKLSPDAGLDGGGAIVIAAMKNDAGQSGYLTHVNPPLGHSYTFILRFSAKVSNTTSYLLGPRFVTTINGAVRDVILDFERGNVRLEQYDPSCDGGAGQICSPILGVATLIDDHWHRYVLRGNVRTPGDSFGDVSLDLDGQTIVNKAPLTVAFHDPQTSSFYVGLTSASPDSNGSLVFDDVQLELKP